MRTRAQVNAWREVTAQHRRDTAAFAAAIAAHATSSSSPDANTSNAPSPASNSPVEAPPSSFITPEKKMRKRKRSPTCSPSSPAVREPKRPPPTPTPTTKVPKAALIRRTLDYTDATKDDKEEATTPRVALERLASGDAATTSSFIGRSDEQRAIERVFTSSATRALFAIGPPGTGKSSCVAHVAAQHDATVVRVNCSTFATPSALFAAIGEQLPFAELPSLDQAPELASYLASAVHAPTAPSGVLVLDEVDYLVRLPSAKAERLLQFFVRWAHLPNATLRFVGILNGVDMHAQIAEFLAHDPNPTSVVLFPSYDLDELVAILNAYAQAVVTGSTIQLHDIIEPRALELIARKVAARDGDARRAVGLLRQCARVCLAQNETRLTIRDVLKCTSSAIASQLSVAKQIQQLPRAPKVLLYAVTRLASCETTTVTLNDIADELQQLQATKTSLAWIPRFHLEELQQHIGSLECYALVKQTAAKSKSAWHTRLTSTIAMDMLTKAFEDDELLLQLPTY